MNVFSQNLIRQCVLPLILIVLSACSSSSNDTSLAANGNTSSGVFSLAPVEQLPLVEGDTVTIPVTLLRGDGHNKNVLLSIDGLQDSDNDNISYSFAPRQISSNASASTITVALAIDALPMKASEQRTFIIGATDGQDTATTQITLNIQPVPAPDVYLLVGQSNMVGFSGAGTKLAYSGGPDEPNPRILQLNVTGNNLGEHFFSDAAFTSVASNVIENDKIVIAEDPLHVPTEPNNGDKEDGNYIGMGLSFAKTALPFTTQSIVLVPAAWSSSSFCDSEFPGAEWNAEPTNASHLGDTLLFDRAVTRANIALSETGGILRGILWHQGESDSFDTNCANSYAANLERLAQQFRLKIDQDRRGGAFRRADANVPFIVGTMSRGNDERGDFAEFWDEKQKVDDAHRNLPNQIAHAEVTLNDRFTPENGFPCGNDFCVHFGAAALREIGYQYYQSLLRAAETP